MNMQSHRRVNTQYIKDLGQNSHIKHFSHHFGFSFQFLVYFPYVSGKKMISRVELLLGVKREDKAYPLA